MPPHPHRGQFNIEPCCSCGGKHSAHTETDAETRCNPKTQRPFNVFLWCAVSLHTHIKRTGEAVFYRGGGLA